MQKQCHCGERWFGYPVCPACARRANEKAEYEQRFQAEIQKAAQAAKEKQTMTRIHNDSLAQEPDYYQEQIDDLQDKVNELKKLVAELTTTVTGLKNVEKSRWQNLINRLKD